MGSIWLCWVICAPRSFVSPLSNSFPLFESHTTTSLLPAKNILQMNTMQGVNCIWRKFTLKFLLCFSFSGVRSFQQMWHRPVCNLLLGTANVSKMDVSAASPCDMFLLFFKVLTGASRQFLILNSWDKLKLWTKRCGMRYRMFTCPKTTFKIISQLLFWRELDSS